MGIRINTLVTRFEYYFIFKPYGMLSQFSTEGSALTLTDFPFSFPKDVYPVGRLDSDSEGLLLLTNNKKLNLQLLSPNNHVSKKYWVQVEGDISDNAITQLSTGVTITLPSKKTHLTKPCEVKKLSFINIPERNPPIRFRKNIPTTWLEISLQEGKNRQIRKMTAKVGFPTLRIIRVGIGKYFLKNIPQSPLIIKLKEDDVINYFPGIKL